MTPKLQLVLIALACSLLFAGAVPARAEPALTVGLVAAPTGLVRDAAQGEGRDSQGDTRGEQRAASAHEESRAPADPAGPPRRLGGGVGNPGSREGPAPTHGEPPLLHG